VARNDTVLLVVLGGIAGQLEDLSGEVLEDGAQVDWGTGTNAACDALAAEVSRDTTDWELETSLCGARGWLRCRLLSTTTTCSDNTRCDSSDNEWQSL
jgi:hypothetical protein